MKLNTDLMLNRRRIREQAELRRIIQEGQTYKLVQLLRRTKAFIEKIKYYRGWENE